jgi:hypothetical protein
MFHDCIVSTQTWILVTLTTGSLSDCKTQNLLLLAKLLFPIQEVVDIPHMLLQPLKLFGSELFLLILRRFVKQVRPNRSENLASSRTVTWLVIARTRYTGQDAPNHFEPGCVWRFSNRMLTGIVLRAHRSIPARGAGHYTTLEYRIPENGYSDIGLREVSEGAKQIQSVLSLL